MIRRLVQRAREDRGAYAVLYAIIVTVMVGMSAIMLDLGALRADARANQTVSDFAATAGALELDPVSGGSAYDACLSAWNYFLANTSDAPSSATPPCDTFAGVAPCDPIAPVERVAIGTAGPYQVTIVHAVLDGSPYMDSRLNSDIDGGPCDRVAVRIVRSRGFVLGPVLGSTSGKAPAQAVARSFNSNGQGEGVALVILDPTGCKALIAKGQASVTVQGPVHSPGVITLDSSGTETNSTQARNCKVTGNNGDYTVDAEGTQNSSIRAVTIDAAGNEIGDGAIFSYAVTGGSTFAYQEQDVTAGRLSPRPVPGQQVTRSPIDWRYNCKVANDCPYTDTNGPHIDELRATVGTTGVPAGFQVYGDDPGEKCRLPSSADQLFFTGDWYIACSLFDIAVPVTFSGGNVVFEGTVNVGGTTGFLSINDGSTTDRWAYFRAGGSLEKDAQASVILDHTFVYLDDGTITLKAGSGALEWIAPEAGNFEDLALWSESPLAHELGGQSGLNIEGTFFTPNAWPFRYSGQADQVMKKAQFIVWRMEVTGQGALRMEVDPERATLIPLQGIRLIR